MTSHRGAGAPTLPVIGVVLSGGSSARMGRDKASIDLGGRSLLQHVLDGFAGVPVIVVGPVVACTHADVRFVREDPPGGGPCAAVVAGAMAASGHGASVMAVVATDMPAGAPVALVAAVRLAASGPEVDAVIPLDSQGEAQVLCAAYRVSAIVDWALGLGDVAGASVRSLAAALKVESWRPADVGDALLDIDDQDALDRARVAREHRAP